MLPPKLRQFLLVNRTGGVFVSLGSVLTELYCRRNWVEIWPGGGEGGTSRESTVKRRRRRWGRSTILIEERKGEDHVGLGKRFRTSSKFIAFYSRGERRWAAGPEGSLVLGEEAKCAGKGQAFLIPEGRTETETSMMFITITAQ